LRDGHAAFAEFAKAQAPKALSASLLFEHLGNLKQMTAEYYALHTGAVQTGGAEGAKILKKSLQKPAQKG
jgi:hypothetical protein